MTIPTGELSRFVPCHKSWMNLNVTCQTIEAVTYHVNALTLYILSCTASASKPTTMKPCTTNQKNYASNQEVSIAMGPQSLRKRLMTLQPEHSNMSHDVHNDVPNDVSQPEMIPALHDNPGALNFAEAMENLRTAHATEIHEEKARLEQAHQIQHAAAVQERERLKKAYQAHVARLQDRLATQAVRIYMLEESLYETGDDQDADLAEILERYEVLCDLKERIGSKNAGHNDSSNAAREPTTDGDNDVVNADSSEVGNGGWKDEAMSEAMGEALEEKSRAGNAEASTKPKRSSGEHSGGDKSNPPSKKMWMTTGLNLLNFVERDPPRSALRMDPNYTPAENNSSILSWTAEFDRNGNVWRCPKCDWELVDEEDFLGSHCPEYAPRGCPKCQLRTGDQYKLA